MIGAYPHDAPYSHTEVLCASSPLPRRSDITIKSNVTLAGLRVTPRCPGVYKKLIVGLETQVTCFSLKPVLFKQH